MSSESGGGSLRELIATFFFGVETDELEKGKSKLNEFVEHVAKVGEAVIAAFAVDAIYEFVEGQAHAMNAIERTGSQLGITTERVQEFQFAAKSMGLEVDALLNSMGRLQVSQQAAASGSGTQARAFHDLGVNVKDVNGHMKSADDLMLDVADGIRKTVDPSKRAALAVGVFGREGRQLLPFLEEGRAGAEEYFKTFKELGGGYTEDAMKAGKDFEKQQAKTNLVLTSLKNTIARALLPIITSLASGAQKAMKWFGDLAKGTHIVEASLITLGSIAGWFALQMAIAEAPLLLLAAAVAAVILIVDDLYGFLTGGDSAIGGLIDKIFGKGAQTDALKSIRDGWDSIKETFRTLAPYVHDVVDALKWVVDNAGKLGGFIGDLSGKAAVAGAQNAYDNNEGGLRGNRKKSDIFKQRMEAVKHGQVFVAPGETFDQAKLAASVIEQQFLTPSVDRYAPMIAGGGAGSNTTNVTVNVPNGMDPKAVGEHVANAIDAHNKQERRSAAATVPRSGG